MSGLLGESLRVLPPTSVTHTSVTDTSTSAVAIGGTGYYVFGVTKSAGDGVFVLFGTSAVSAATSSNGMHISPGEKVTLYISGHGASPVTHFRAIRNGSTTESLFHCKTGD